MSSPRSVGGDLDRQEVHVLVDVVVQQGVGPRHGAVAVAIEPLLECFAGGGFQQGRRQIAIEQGAEVLDAGHLDAGVVEALLHDVQQVLLEALVAGGGQLAASGGSADAARGAGVQGVAGVGDEAGGRVAIEDVEGGWVLHQAHVLFGCSPGYGHQHGEVAGYVAGIRRHGHGGVGAVPGHDHAAAVVGGDVVGGADVGTAEGVGRGDEQGKHAGSEVLERLATVDASVHSQRVALVIVRQGPSADYNGPAATSPAASSTPWTATAAAAPPTSASPPTGRGCA